MGLKIELYEVKNVIENVLEKMFKDEIKKKTYDPVTADAVSGMIFGELVSVASREFETEKSKVDEKTKALEEEIEKISKNNASIEEYLKSVYEEIKQLKSSKEESASGEEVEINIEEGAKIGD